MKLEYGKLYVIYSNNLVEDGIRYYAGMKDGIRMWTSNLQEALVLDAIGVINTPELGTNCGTISTGMIEVKQTYKGEIINLSTRASISSL